MTRSKSTYLAAVAVLLSPMAANADPITFTFDMPAFTNGPLAGQTSVLDVTVDNGNSIFTNQSYLNSQITDLFASIAGASFGRSVNTVSPAITTYIMTDAFGLATLDLTAVLDSFVRSRPGGRSFIQLGTQDNGGPIRYALRRPTDDGFSHINSRDLVVTQTVAVPEPGTLALLGIGLFGMGIARRRKKA